MCFKKRLGAVWDLPVVPVFRFELDCPDMECAGCPERVRGALDRARGVRAVTSSRTHLVVYYDGRRIRPDGIRKIVKGQGFSCEKE